MMRILLSSLLLLGALAVPALAQSNVPRSLRDVGFDQHLNEQIPLDLKFRDETGRVVRLGEYFSDRPVIMVLAYYRCPMLCTEVLNGLTRALLDLFLSPGKDFTILTVSFDPREKPALAAAKKKTYVERLGRTGAEDGWHFLTGTEPNIKQLTKAVGFRYRYDEETDQYAHASGIVVLTPGGKVSRYFYDIRYSPRDLRLGLVEASDNRIGTPVDQILLYCFHYDPKQGRYGPAVMGFVRLGGVMTMLCMAGYVTWLWRKDRRDRKTPGGV